MTLYELGEEIKKLRRQKTITQEALCNIAGISRPTLSRLENGEFANVSVRSLDKILNALGYEISITPSNPFRLPVLEDE
ncbi:MAG: helix-turn-helix transcriptional regulator [Spirochaetes bacterium]|nr:helix-turn-helix transcriptional regulator [Spirochaetota bacterium]